MPRTIDLEKQAQYMQYRTGGAKYQKDTRGRVREYRRHDQIYEWQWGELGGGVLCYKCGRTIYDRDEWGRNAKYIDGYSLYCKACMRETMKNPWKRRTLKIRGPGRAWVTPRVRALWDKRVARGERFTVVAPDGQMFWWGRRLRRLGLEEETEFLEPMAKAVSEEPAMDNETAKMMKFWDDVIAKEEQSD